MTILDTLLLVIVDEPGRERDALRTMLASIQNVRIVEILDSCKDLQVWMNNRYPDVVVVRARSGIEDGRELVKSIKTNNPQARFLVIAEKSEEVHAYLSEGIDYVFLRGFSSTELFALLDKWSMDKLMHCFSEERKESPVNSNPTFLEMLI